MNRVIALAAREMSERKLLFLGAALVAVITLLVPLAPIPGGYAYRDVVDVGAYVFALLLVAGGGLVLGATTIGRDLSSGRIAFFFTRELHAWEIWAGRILGMFVTVVVAATIVLTPATLLGGGLVHLVAEWKTAGPELLNAMLLAVMLPLAAHYMSVALRSRSAWLALDVVALCAAAGVLWTLALPFLPFWFGKPRSLGAIFLIVTVILALAGWVGLAKGRISPVAVHRWSLATLWSLVAVSLLGFAGWRAWVFSVSPGDVDFSKGWAYEIDGNGEWIGIGSGEKTGRGGIPHEFLMSTKSGAWMRVDDSEPVAVSADGRVAVIAKRSWAWRPSRWVDTTIQVVDLTAKRLEARDSGITIPELIWSAPALSADGSRVAIIEAKGVSVHSLRDETLLASFPLERRHWSSALFIDDATLQVTSSDEAKTVVERFDIAGKRRLSRIELQGNRYRIDPTGARIAIASSTPERSGRITICDTITGGVLGGLDTKASPVGRRFHWLVDGGFAVATAEFTPRDGQPGLRTEGMLAVHAADGAERIRIPFPGAKRIAIVGEQTEGQLLVVWSDSDNITSPCAGDTRLVAIDLATGGVRQLPFEGWPRAYSWRAPAQRGTVGSRLFSDCNGTMVMYDVATGEMRELLGGK